MTLWQYHDFSYTAILRVFSTPCSPPHSSLKHAALIQMNRMVFFALVCDSVYDAQHVNV